MKVLFRWMTPFLLVAVVVIAGCTPKSPGTSTSTSKQFKIAGVVFQEDQFFRMVEYGMKEAARENDVELLMANSSNAPDRESSLVDTYAGSNVDAICIAPLSVKASIPALQRAHDKGIKIVTFDGSLDADFPVCGIASVQEALGKSTGEACREYIEKQLGGKAKLALIEYMSLAPEVAKLRVGGFKGEVSKLPGVEIVVEQDAWMAPEAANVVQNILTAHPDVNIIWAANEGGTVGAVTGVRNAGKVGKVFVFGTDMSEQMADFLTADDNVLQAVTAQQPIQIGKTAVEMAVKALKGETVEKKVALPGILYRRGDSTAIDTFKQSVKSLGK